MLRSRKPRGQGLVEFALILPALLLIVLSIIEGGLLFQSYLAIQHAAREAARFAVAYQPPMEYSMEQAQDLMEGRDPGTPAFDGETEEAWHARRVALVKQRALDQAMGIRILYPVLDEVNLLGLMDRPGFFGVRVWGFPAFDQEEQLDHPGLEGLPVRVRIHYRWEPLDPLIQVIVPNGVMLTAEATMINEGVQVGLGSVLPPTFAPPPPLEEPTEAPTWTPTPLPNTTPLPTNTPTPTPTATPVNPPYVALIDEGGYERDPWMLGDLQYGRAQLRPSTFVNPGVGYEVYWEAETCTTALDLDITLTTDNRTSGPLGNEDFLCGETQDGEYQAWLSICCDAGGASIRSPINVLLYTHRPDLVVRIVVPTDTIPMAVPTTVNVEVTNIGQQEITDTFDVDIYLDPDRTPILPGQPGFLPVGTDAAKQWVHEPIPAGASRVLTFTVTLPDSGEHLLWAQADTSARVEEAREQNNTAGPVAVMASCSERCDDFQAPTLDPKWESLAGIGALGALPTPVASDFVTVTAGGELEIGGIASPLLSPTTGKVLMLHQGPYTDTESFDMRVKITDYPNRHLSMAGLMVREGSSASARYAAIGVVNVDGAPYFQAVVRDTDGAVPADPCPGRTAAPGGSAWVRITRAGDLLSLYTSGNGQDWQTDDCMQVMMAGLFSTTEALPGIFAAPLPAMNVTTTPWRNPSANRVDYTSGGANNEKGFESHPTYAYSDGASYAESRDNGAAGGDLEHTDRHYYYSYGFAIPTTAAVLGIELEMDWWLDAIPAAGEATWLGAELTLNAGAATPAFTPIKVDGAPLRTVEGQSILGAAADTWGRTWTPAEINAAGFGVRLSAYSANVERDFYLDWVPVRVTYAQVQDASAPDSARFDYFELCPLDRAPPPTRPKPVGLRECGNVIVNGTFPENSLSPWVDGQESPAVVPRGGYSCDSGGRPNYGYSMLLRCDRMQSGYYVPYHPWAYQDFTVPSFVTSTQPLSVEVVASLYHLEPAESHVSTEPITPTFPGTFGSANDALEVWLTRPQTETKLIPEWDVVYGGSGLSEREHWWLHVRDLQQDLAAQDDSISNYAGQDLRLWVVAPNEDYDEDGVEDGDTLFYVDQVRLDICTTVQPPTEAVSDTVWALSGDVRVVIEGFREPMPGVDVWAIEVPSDPDTDTDDFLGYYTTYAIQDSTYSFHNLSPGDYRVYAQVWVSGQLYWATERIILDPELTDSFRMNLTLRQ